MKAFLLLALLLANAQILAHSASDCRSLPSNAVRITAASVQAAPIRTRYTVKALNTMPETRSPRGIVGGYTRGYLASQVFSTVHRSKARDCLSIEVELRLSIDPLEVHIAHEFLHKGCVFQEVKQHEFEHVEVFRRELKRIRSAFAHVAAGLFFSTHFSGPGAQAKAEALRKRVEQLWAEKSKAYLKEITAAQQAVDTDHEYQRMGKVCGGRALRIAQASL